MSATASGKEETKQYRNCDSETATVSSNIAREANGEKVLVPEKKLQACPSCQHLYDQKSEVVLAPAALCHNHNSIRDVKETGSSLPPAQAKTWKSRRYEDLCGCSEAGQVCHCNASSHRSYTQYLQITAGTFWGPRIKKTLLVIAATIPFIFLIVYLIFTYK